MVPFPTRKGHVDGRPRLELKHINSCASFTSFTFFFWRNRLKKRGSFLFNVTKDCNTSLKFLFVIGSVFMEILNKRSTMQYLKPSDCKKKPTGV